MVKLTPFKIVAVYAVLSIVWITSSDLLLELVAKDTREFTVLSVTKGWLFIAVTTGLLYGLIHRYAVDRTRAAQALRDSEQQFRFLVEHATDGIIIAQDGMLRYANPAVSQVSGYTAEKLLSQPFSEFVHPDDRAMVLDRHYKRLDGLIEPTHISSFRMLTKDGRTVWIEARGALCTWNDRPATINSLTDVTARRQAEEEMLRTEKLRTVGELAGGIAHDFNNILTAVLANISLAQTMADAGLSVRERLAEAEAATLRAGELTKQLLTFSRGGAPVRKPFAPATALRESTVLTLRGRGTDSSIRIAQDLWNIDADEGQIGQVMNNLVLNASQAMAGGGTVTITAMNVVVDERANLELPNGRYVEITVADQGGGIAPEHLSRIFEPYFTTKREGSGLGLAVCYSIAKNHAGTITVRSEPGRGSSFTVYLPATDKPLPAPERKNDRLVTGQGRVLVMDDTELVREAAGEIITTLGYEVALVDDGSAAIEAYQQARQEGRPFGVVIMDLTVPGGMGGKEAVRELLAIDPKAKVVVSSGYHQDPIMANFMDHGFLDFIAKPYNAKELSTVLARVVRNRIA